MQRLTYLFSLFFIKVIALMPFRLLYFFSDFLFLLLFKVLGYRKSVVQQNLANAFPDKSKQERDAIMKRYYRHLTDVLLETLKSYGITRKGDIINRCPIVNPEVFTRYFNEGKHVIVVTGHYGNWEWAALTSANFTRHHMQAVYQPLSNKHFDQFLRKNRSKFGLHMIAADKVASLFRHHNKETLSATVFLGDQGPANVRKNLWLPFLNQETCVNIAIERLARMMDWPVIYGEIQKVKRGQFEIRLVELVEKPKQTEYGEITAKHTRHLEKMIRDKPEYWLWSHRRWKRSRPEEVEVHNFAGS